MNINQNKQTVTCPQCATQINVNALLHSQIEAELRQHFAAESARKQAEYEQLATMLNAQKLQLDYEKQTLQTQISESVEQQLKSEKLKLEQALRTNIKADLEAESAARFQQMENELNQKSQQVKELNRAKADIARLNREKDELTEAVKAEAALELNQRLREERQKVESQIEMKMRDKDYEIEKLKNQIQEAQRVAEQGSTQAQGEVQELAIEEWLREKFPLDEISEIKKGQRGADCVQTVNTRTQYNCGKICYESKRTENFNKEWIEKFKTDLRSENATIGVLVTKTMPKELERMGLIDGVWVCTFDEFKGLSAVLRESIIQISNLIATQENKGEKKEMLYNFVTSNEFKSQMDTVNETFTQMREDLHKERMTMERLWKQREKQIDKVLLNNEHFCGAITGILGNTIQGESKFEPAPVVIESKKTALVSSSVKSNTGIKQDSLF